MSLPSCAVVLSLVMFLHLGLGTNSQDTNDSTPAVQHKVMNFFLHVPATETPPFQNVSMSTPSNEFTGHQKTKLTDQGHVSREQYETVRLVVDVILKPAVCIVGLVLNVIGIWVLLQPQLRHGFYIYLATLSIADSGYLLCGLFRASVKIYSYFNLVESKTLQGTVVRYMDPFVEVSLCKLGAYCIILFSIDRLVAVTRPLKVKDFFLSRYSKHISVSLVLFIFIFYLPKLTELETVNVFYPSINMTIVEKRPIRRNATTTMGSFMSAYNLTVNILFNYLPPVVLCIVNLLIIIQVQRIAKSRKRLFGDSVKKSKSSIDQHKLVATVFVISAFFLAVYIPLIISNNLKSHHPDFGRFQREHYLSMLFPTFISFGWSVNAAIDFTVYLATSERFRQTLRSTCCKKQWKKRDTLLNSPVISRSWTIIQSVSSSSISKKDEDMASENGSYKLERKEYENKHKQSIFVLSESKA